jgi:ankyrin repeat protein
VQALVKIGGEPSRSSNIGWTPLVEAANNKRIDIVAFLLGLPAVQASINAISQGNPPYTALSSDDYWGYEAIVQLLLAAGANPTLPAGEHSPLNRALSHNHHEVAALLRSAIAEPDRPRSLLKCRALVDAKRTRRAIADLLGAKGLPSEL